MIGFLSLLAASIALLLLSALNAKNIVLRGRTNAYVRTYTFRESPVAFVVSATCTLLALARALTLLFSGLAILCGYAR